MNPPPEKKLFLKVIACEIAFRELSYLAARCRNLIDLEFLTQGHHDKPAQGRTAIQVCIDAVPPGKYDAIVLGYGLCSNILAGLVTRHTPLVIPRAHDCITFFLGSKQRYEKLFEENPGTYYYTSGWLECHQRRGLTHSPGSDLFMPAASQAGGSAIYAHWVKKYGEEKARYLQEVMREWTAHYTRGALIDFDFTKSLQLAERVKQICDDRGWGFEELDGDLGLFQRLLEGVWEQQEVLVVKPQQQVLATYNHDIIGAAQAPPEPETSSASPDA